MKTIGFIGAYDKTDFIIYIAKALETVGKKVLVIDNTKNQKTRYVVPAINPTKAYVTDYENIDVSIGFSNYEEIKRYLGTPIEKELEYDIALVDIDSIENFENFNMKNATKNYFVTSFDLYSLKKGIEVLNNLPEPTNITKVLFAKDMLKEDEEYLDFLSLGSKAIWNEEYRIYLPLGNGDENVIMENQRVAKIGLRKLSTQYKEGLYYIVEDILQDVQPQQIKKAFKLLEREV